MQRLLPVAAAALLALVVWFLLGGDAPPKDEQDLAAPAIAGLSDGLESEDLESAPGDTDAAGNSAERDASERVALEASVAAEEDAASAAQLWQARIHLARIDGTVDERPSGMVSYSVRQERGGQLFDGEVIDGTLSFQPMLRGSGAASFAASYGEFGDIHAWNEAEAPPIGPESIPTIVLVERVRPLLEVFEWGTELRIPEVDLVLGESSVFARFREPNPGPRPALWKSKASVPYAIEMHDLNSVTRRIGWQTFLVGAPGYAWTSTTVEFGEPRHRVELQRGGGLRVVVEGLPSYSGLSVALLAEDSGKEIGTWSLNESGALTLEGVRAGSVLARVSSPDPTQSEHYLGEGRATVVAGTTTELRCVIDPLNLDSPEAFNVQVTLEVPTTWGALPDSVTLYEPQADRADIDWRVLSFAEVDRQGDPWVARLLPVELATGRWRLSTEDPAWATEFEVVQDSVLRFAIPAPVDSTLEVIDAQTQERVPGLSVFWSAAYDEGKYEGLGFAQETDTPGIYSLRTPLTDVKVRASSPIHAGGALRVSREELGGLLRLELNRSQGVSLRLRISDELDYGDAPAWETELRAGGVDGENRVSGKRGTSTGGSHRFRFAAAEPGMYALCVPELPGFELVEPIEIEIPAGEFVTHEVWLAKRP